MSGAVAYFALFSWPIVCAVLFNRLAVERALIWSILGGYLLLPPLTEIDLPLVPELDKYSIPSISAFFIVVFVLKQRISLLPGGLFTRFLVLAFVINAIPTVLSNPDPIVFEIMAGSDPIEFITGELPGLEIRDMLSVFVLQTIVLLPFLLGYQLLGTEKGLQDLLVITMLGALVYSIPALIEIRLSPQMNVWVYGFFQHDFAQMIRDDGYRPIVFLPHALWLSFFVMTSVVAAAALTRHAEPDTRLRFLLATGYLAVLLVLCKSLASQLYAMSLLPFVFLAGRRLQMVLAVSFAVLAITYPMLRNLGLVPLDVLLAQAEAINPVRAASLEYRFNNEELLLDRAREKWMFGWGGWGRNLVHHAETGQIISVPDGRWIISFGTYGWFGYLSEMGLLATPIALLAWHTFKAPKDIVSPFAVALALMLAITMIDMLLNDTLVPFTWLIAGAILGYCKALAKQQQKEPYIGKAVIGSERARNNRPRTVL